MGALIWREVVTITRTPAYWVGAAVYIVALAAFVAIWGNGIPVAGARSSWEQFVSVAMALLAVLLPWVAARCGCSSRRELVMTGFITSRSPEQCLLAKSIGLMVALMGVELSGLPVFTLMRQIAAEPSAIVSSAISLAVLAMYVAVVTIAIAFILTNPLRVWIASTALTLVATAGRLPAGVGLLIVGGIAIAATLYLSSMRARMIYLAEHER